MIAIGSDHAGCQMKEAVKQYLTEQGIAVQDVGTQEGVPADYPDIANIVCDAVTRGDCEKGILICGTGIGMSMAANKRNGIRAAVCSDSFSTRYTRLHNDANVMCIGARVMGDGIALELVDLFLHTEFEGGRHQRRVDKIMQAEFAPTSQDIDA